MYVKTDKENDMGLWDILESAVDVVVEAPDRLIDLAEHTVEKVEETAESVEEKLDRLFFGETNMTLREIVWELRWHALVFTVAFIVSSLLRHYS